MVFITLNKYWGTGYEMDFYSTSKIYNLNEVLAFQEELSISLPEQYIRFLMTEGAGFFTIDYDKRLPTGTKFESFYTISTILDIQKCKSDYNIPNNLVLFGSDDVGNFICFDELSAKIMLFEKHHGEIVLLAENFIELLKII